MTRISFLHGAPDRIQSAAHWLQQAWGGRQTVLVYVPDAEQATNPLLIPRIMHRFLQQTEIISRRSGSKSVWISFTPLAARNC